MTSKEIIENDNSFYCYTFIATRSNSLINAARRTGIPEISQHTSNGFTYFYKSQNSDGSNQYVSVINDLNDYSLEALMKSISSNKPMGSSHNSILSFAAIDEAGFICASDSWGIQTHYWFKNEDSFICSNNIFMVAFHVDAELSERSFFEYLFFLAPMKDHTWFADIRRLYPGQSLFYDAEQHSFNLSQWLDPVDELIGSDTSANEIEESVYNFFKEAKANIGERKAALSLSAGSDSRTVLSCLRKLEFQLLAYSFGSIDLCETKEIEELSKKFQINWNLIELKGSEIDWPTRFKRTTIVSNGYINALRTHYEMFYDAIPSNEVIFEGILGSEFVKGELCPGATVSRYYAEVIGAGEAVETIVEKRFKLLAPSLRKKIKEYICDEYSPELLNVNTDEGFYQYNSMAFRFLPSCIFSGMISLAIKNHSAYYPFLSFNILKSIYGMKLGSVKNISIRKDHEGIILDLLPEILIAKRMDNKVYKSVLDRSVTFKEVFEYPISAVKIIKKIRDIKKKIKFRNYIFGQLDNSEIEKYIYSYVSKSKDRHPFVEELSEDSSRSREAVNICMILDILNEGL